MEGGTEGELFKQFQGSGLANLAFGLLFLLYMGAKKLCNRPSKCKSHIHCCCIELDVSDKTIRSLPEVDTEEETVELSVMEA